MIRVSALLSVICVWSCAHVQPEPTQDLGLPPATVRSKFQEDIKKVPLEDGSFPSLWGPVGKTLTERFYGVWEFDGVQRGSNYVFYLFSPGFVMHIVEATPHGSAIRATPGFWAVESADGHIGHLLMYSDDKSSVSKVSFEFTDPDEVNFGDKHFLRTGLTPDELLPSLTNPWRI